MEPHEAAKRYRVALWRQALRRFLWIVFRPLFHLLFRVRVIGREKVPKTGAYLIAYNHVSLFEPPLILAFWPKFPEALAGHDVWERRGQGTLVKGYGAIPVKRGEYDREVMDKMIAVLESGYPLMISPEGGRSHAASMRRALPGVAYLVDRTHVPVVPVAIVGTHDDSLRHALKGKRDLLEIRIGESFMLPPIVEKGKDRREARQRNADQVMLRIAAMLPDSYHGVYAEMVKSASK